MHRQMDDFSPDWVFASNHGKASVPGRKLALDSNGAANDQKEVLCPCCLNFIETEPEPLCNHSKELNFLGTGFPVFYLFIRYCIILLLLTICSYSALSLYKAIIYNYQPCYDDLHSSDAHRRLLGSTFHCTSWMIRLSRTEKYVKTEETFLRIFSFVIHLAFLVFMRNRITKTIEYFDERTCSLSDYALKIKGIPLQDKTREKLRRFFRKAFSTSHEFKQLTLLAEFQRLDELDREKAELVTRIGKLRRQSSPDQEEIDDQQRKLRRVKGRIEDVLEERKKEAEADAIQSSKCILVFETEAIKHQIIAESKSLRTEDLQEYFEGDCSGIRITEAPEPREIIWEDINYPKQKRYLRILLGWALSVAFVAVATVVFFFILSEKAFFVSEELEERRDLAIFLVYLLVVLVILFNKFVMGFVLHYFTHLEKHDSTHKLEASFSLKYALGMFFTTALMTLAVEAIRFGNYYSHLYGVIEEETVFFFMNAFFVPFIWIVNPFQIFVLVRRRLYFNSPDVTQARANHLMENFHYDMGKRYAQILETMWFTFLYLTLIPFGSMLTFAGLAIYYWVDKYNLLRRSSLKSQMSGKLGLFAMKLLDLTLFFRAIGELLFDVELRDGVHAETIVFVVLSVLYFVLPIDKLISFFHHEEFFIEEKTYTEVQHRFKDTYHSLHPVYNRMHKEKLQKRLKNVINEIVDSDRDLMGGSHSKIMV